MGTAPIYESVSSIADQQKLYLVWSTYWSQNRYFTTTLPTIAARDLTLDRAPLWYVNCGKFETSEGQTQAMKLLACLYTAAEVSKSINGCRLML